MKADGLIGIFSISFPIMGILLEEYMSKQWGVLEFKAELLSLIRKYNTLTNRNLFYTIIRHGLTKKEK